MPAKVSLSMRATVTAGLAKRGAGEPVGGCDAAADGVGDLWVAAGAGGAEDDRTS